MTNEELAAAIKQGDEGLIYELWEQIKGLGAWYSRKYAEIFTGSGVAKNQSEAFEDLFYGCCYPAFYSTIEKFDPERKDDGGFASLFRYYFLKEAFIFYGLNKRAKDPILNAVSLNALVPGLDGDIELGDTIPDPVDPYEQPERVVYLEQLHNVMDAALDSISAKLSDVIRKRHFERLTNQEIADRIGTTKQYVFDLEKKGYRKIRRGKYAPQLWAFLCPDYDYRSAGLSGNGYHTFQANGSSTERGAINHVEMLEREEQRLQRIIDSLY